MKSKCAFSNISAHSKQKLVYNLLNTARADDSAKFFDTLLRAINANVGGNNDKRIDFIQLSRSIESVYNNVRISGNFEKISHAIILGILASDKNQGGN